MYYATMFTPTGKSETRCGITPERAMQWAEDDLFCPVSKEGWCATFRPEDGVIFRNGAACGVVYYSEGERKFPLTHEPR